MEDKTYYCKILQKLYTGHPAKRLLCTDVQRNESGKVKKSVTTVSCGAQPKDYAKHLHAGSFDGAGALGIIPTFSESIGLKRGWFVQFLARDFDTLSLKEIMPLIAVLEEYRVYVYLDRGTTGQGIHLYVFLSDPMRQRQAHEVLTTIAGLCKQLKLPYPEFMPSSASTAGKGIFLPYRGASDDGFGANPLIDPIGGTQIPLDAADPDAVGSEVFRTEVEDLKALVENLGVTDSKSTTSRNPSHTSTHIGSYAGGLKAWGAEMTRLNEVWVEGKRQNLTLGATAYGISLGVTADGIRSSIEALEKASSDPEVDERMKAVDGTVEKHVKGQRIAWRKFYKLADVEPPGANKVVPWEVILRLQVLEDRLGSAPFKGMGGFTDSDVLDSLIEIGRRYGKLRPEGVEVSISVRALAEVARVGSDTVINSLKRLSGCGWVSRGNRSEGTNSGSLILLINDGDVAAQGSIEGSENEKADERDSYFPVPKFRWGAGRLGKTSRPILQILQRLQPCTRADVARAMGRESRGIRNPMNRLWEHGLLVYDEETNTYTLAPDFQDRLFEVQLADGTLDTDFKHKKRFELQRMAYRTLLSFKKGKKNQYKLYEGGVDPNTPTKNIERVTGPVTPLWLVKNSYKA